MIKVHTTHTGNAHFELLCGFLNFLKSAIQYTVPILRDATHWAQQALLKETVEDYKQSQLHGALRLFWNHLKEIQYKHIFLGSTAMYFRYLKCAMV